MVIQRKGQGRVHPTVKGGFTVFFGKFDKISSLNLFKMYIKRFIIRSCLVQLQKWADPKICRVSW